jgi:hypothetical protein
MNIMPMSVYMLCTSDCYGFLASTRCRKMTPWQALHRLTYDREALALVIDTYSWIVEEEVSYRFGTPSWFPRAPALVFLEIVSRAANYAPERDELHRRIRAAARRAALSLERALWNDPTGLDLIQSKSSRRDLESLVTDLLNARMSLFWADLRRHRSPANPACSSSRSLKEVWDVDG